MLKIIPIIESCNNICITKDGIENVRLTDFEFAFIVDIDFNSTNSSDLNFILDESVDNNFDFSFTKNCESRQIIIRIFGDSTRNFKIKGMELNDNRK